MENWRLIIQGKIPGAENMSFDSGLLDKAVLPDSVPTLRFYDWLRPTITLGYLQKTDNLDYEKCKREGVDVAVRPTGGRAVLHWEELTYSITIPSDHPISSLHIMESYRMISEALIAGFIELGIPAEFSRGDALGYKSASCFSSASRYEVVVGGRKLVGSAQRRRGGALLQQGSIPIGAQFRRLGEFFPDDPLCANLADKATCIRECISELPKREKMIAELAKGFERVFEISFIEP
jgi:lipoyl(octanoyl) transferase